MQNQNKNLKNLDIIQWQSRNLHLSLLQNMLRSLVDHLTSKSLCCFLSGVMTPFCILTRFCADTSGAVLVKPHWSGSSVSTANMSNTLHSPQHHPPDGQQPSANQVSSSSALN